jgi:ABC-2 type transport system ATP-binding protein
MKTVLDIKNLTHNFGDVVAVDSLTLSVRKGEVFGFLGPNGAGKTTTIKSILGLLKPTSGQIKINGISVRDNKRKSTIDVGYLPENLVLYDNLTGRETLQFFVDLKSASKREVEELLEKLDLKPAADRKVGGYSKGMVQRLAIAQSLIGKPSILILDEPTSGLDPEGTSLVKDIVKDYKSKGKTVFFSSHILPNVQEVADRVGIIRQGKLQALNSVEKLRENLEMPSKLHISLSDNFERILNQLEENDMIIGFYGKDKKLTVKCKREDKMDILKTIEKQGFEIRDFSTEESDLEDIFLRYTEEGYNE